MTKLTLVILFIPSKANLQILSSKLKLKRKYNSTKKYFLIKKMIRRERKNLPRNKLKRKEKSNQIKNSKILKEKTKKKVVNNKRVLSQQNSWTNSLNKHF